MSSRGVFAGISSWFEGLRSDRLERRVLKLMTRIEFSEGSEGGRRALQELEELMKAEPVAMGIYRKHVVLEMHLREMGYLKGLPT